MGTTALRFSARITALLLASLLAGCSGGGPASISYEFATPAFSAGELEKIQSKVHARIEASYEKRNGRSAGCTWILWRKGNSDEPKNRLYFSEKREPDRYVIGISGKRAFRDFAAATEEEIARLAPGRDYRKTVTSRLTKSIQFLKSET